MEPFDPAKAQPVSAADPGQTPARSAGRTRRNEAPQRQEQPKAAQPAERAAPERPQRPQPASRPGPDPVRAQNERAQNERGRNERGQNERTRGRADRDDVDDGVVGFGQDVPAFLAKPPR